MQLHQPPSTSHSNSKMVIMMPFFNQTKKPQNLEKLDNKSNILNFLKALFLVLIIMILYISAFYIFNLSPSTLVYTTKFWFIISNTLILIIAADYGAFSSDVETLHFPDQNNQLPTPNALPYFHVIKSDKTTSFHHARDRADIEELAPREKIIDVVASKDPAQKINELKKVGTLEDEVVVEVEIEDEETETECFEEKDEFSSMSDEEVNRRIEEFIRRFRFQAATDKLL